MNDYTLLLYLYWALSPLCLTMIAIMNHSVVPWPKSKLQVWRNAFIIIGLFLFSSWILPLVLMYGMLGYAKKQYKRYAVLPLRAPENK
jgi:hypothetical protein